MSRSFDLYWSFRSPYCYVSMDRLFALQDDCGLTIHMRHVWPGAMRRSGYFDRLHPNYTTYHSMDAARIADFQGLAYARPVPDPLVFHPETREPIVDQPYIRKLTRLALAARDLGQEQAFLVSLMRLLWDGTKKDWDQGDHLSNCAKSAGLDYQDLLESVDAKALLYDREVDENGKALEIAGHWGVPCMIYEGEVFFGQDRIDVLKWRLGSVKEAIE